MDDLEQGCKKQNGEVTTDATNLKEGCMFFSPSLLKAGKLSSAVILYYSDPV